MALFSSMMLTLLIQKEATRQGVSPKLAVAVATVESGLSMARIGSKGEIGLFQLRPEFFKGNLRDPKTNIRLGIGHLKYWEKHCPVKNKNTWITCYNQGARKPHYPELNKYYLAVMKASR